MRELKIGGIELEKSNLKEGGYYKILMKEPVRFKIEKNQDGNYIITIFSDKGDIKHMPFNKEIFNNLISKGELTELLEDEAMAYEI